MSELVSGARAEASVRVLRTWVAAGAAGCVVVALMTTLTPVVLNGDPATLGEYGIVYGSAAGAAPAVIVAAATVLGLLGSDLDRGLVRERLMLGWAPTSAAAVQALLAAVLALGAWLATTIATGFLTGCDVMGRALLGQGVPGLAPDSVIWAVAVAAPLLALVAVALTWALVVGCRSGAGAVMVAGGLGATWIAVLTLLPVSWRGVAVIHPFALPWRMVGELAPQGSTTLSGAWSWFVLSFALWALAAALLARRGWRRLALA